MTEHRTDRLWHRLGWVRPVALLVTLGTVTSATMAAGLEAQGWYNPAWQYRKAITMDGAQVVGNLSAFPVLVSVTDADLSARALANGFDILFTDADGTSKLDHERTRWVSGTGELIAWVKVTSLTAGVDKTIYMYYGNGGAADQQNAAAVWSNGYEAVYHLDDDFADATGNHAPGVNTGSVDVTGRIGDGQDFDQNNNGDYIDIGNWSVAGSQLTIQSWVRYESFQTSDARIVSKALDQAEQEHVFMLSTIDGGPPNNWRMRLKTGTLDASGTTTLIQPTNTINLNTWYLTAATYDGATMRLLQNGGQVASVGKTGNLRQNGWSIYLGNNPVNGTTNYKALDGILDEVRISSAARPSSWLTTEYNNQRPGATFYSVGPEQVGSQAVSSAVAEIAPNDVLTGSTANAFTYDILVTIGAFDTGVDRVTVTVPASFGDPTVTDVRVGGSPVAYTDNTAAKVISVDLTTKVTSDDTIQILFTADAPTSPDATGQAFTSTVDDAGTPAAPQNTAEGDADGDSSDSNSWSVTTTSTVTQTGYAWSDDVALFTSKGDDVALQFQVGTVYVVGIQVAMDATVTSGDWVLQVREDGLGSWLDVLALGGGESPVWQTYNTHTFAKSNGAVVATGEFGNTTPPGGYTAVDGEFSDDNSGLTDGYTGTNIYTELQYAIRAEPGAASHSYEFRVTYEGQQLSGGYNILAQATPAPACPPAGLPFVDGFNRPNSSTVGNCWTETQMVGDDSRINNNRLQFVTTDLANSPIVFRDFTAVGAGLLRWSYVFNWDRTGAENFYQLWMQLGNSALMVDPNVSNNVGVAVNLKWAGPNDGMINHEGFGYVQGASTTEVAVVSGGPGNDHTIEVIANLNSSTFSLRIDGVLQASGIAFDNSVPIDAVRLYADGVSAPNFGTREFDDVAIGLVSYSVSVAPDGSDTLQQLPTNGSSYSYTFTVTNNSTAIEDFDLFGLPGDTVVAVDSITGASITQGAPSDSARLAGLTAGNSDNAVVWFSVVNAAAGSLDSLFLGGRSVNDASATDSGWVFVRVVKPNITTVKAVDPSGTVAPGTDLTYTLTVTNEGEYDAVGVEILDSLAVEVDFQVGSVVNNLPAGISVAVEYSNDGGSSWTYIPVSGGCGAGASYDGCVTRIRWTLQDDLSYLAPDNTGNVQFVARIK